MIRITLLFTAVIFAVTACGQTPATAEPQAIVTEEVIEAAALPTDIPATEIPPTDIPPTEAPAEILDVESTDAELPAWANVELVNVNTNETFTLADYSGKTVYVHMIATWCTNCRANQRSLNADVVPQVSDDVVFVSIDVQTQLGNGTLAEYTTDNGFEWVFTVANNDLMNALVADFGRSVSNPPSTPHFVIYPDGTVTDLQTGGSSASNVLALIRGDA